MPSLKEISVEIHQFIKANYPDLDYLILLGNAEGSGMSGNGCALCAHEYLSFVIAKENIQHLEGESATVKAPETTLRLVKNES